MKLKKYDNVYIRFFSPDYQQDIRAIVYVRKNEMIIELEDEGVFYNIVGRVDGNVYRGSNERAGSTEIVNAKWVQLDLNYLGIWEQGGYEYFIMFELSGNSK